MYVHLLKEWPRFTWDAEAILPRLGEVRHRQGRISGQMNGLGFKVKEAATLDTLTLDVTKSSEIEGERLNADQVRSSIARRLGMDIGGAVATDRNVEGVVEMMLDATQRYEKPLTEGRLFDWHAGYTADIDHLIPAEGDKRFRVKLTTPFRGKVTRHSGPN